MSERMVAKAREEHEFWVCVGMQIRHHKIPQERTGLFTLPHPPTLTYSLARSQTPCISPCLCAFACIAPDCGLYSVHLCAAGRRLRGHVRRGVVPSAACTHSLGPQRHPPAAPLMVAIGASATWQVSATGRCLHSICHYLAFMYMLCVAQLGSSPPIVQLEISAETIVATKSNAMDTA